MEIPTTTLLDLVLRLQPESSQYKRRQPYRTAYLANSQMLWSGLFKLLIPTQCGQDGTFRKENQPTHLPDHILPASLCSCTSTMKSRMNPDLTNGLRYRRLNIGADRVSTVDAELSDDLPAWFSSSAAVSMAFLFPASLMYSFRQLIHITLV